MPDKEKVFEGVKYIPVKVARQDKQAFIKQHTGLWFAGQKDEAAKLSAFHDEAKRIVDESKKPEPPKK